MGEGERQALAERLLKASRRRGRPATLSDEAVELARFLLGAGVSSRRVAEALAEELGVRVSHTTVLRAVTRHHV